MSKSDYLSHELLDHVLGTGAYTAPTAYAQLDEDVPDRDGTGGTAASYTSHDRVDVSTSFEAAGTTNDFEAGNDTQISFPKATGDGNEIIGFSLWDNATLGMGNLLYRGWLVETWYGFTGATDDSIVAPGTSFSNGDVLVVFGRSLPTGLAENTKYFVINVAGETFDVSLTSGGAAVNITAAGGGKLGILLPRTILTNDTPVFNIGELVIAEE